MIAQRFSKVEAYNICVFFKIPLITYITSPIPDDHDEIIENLVGDKNIGTT